MCPVCFLFCVDFAPTKAHGISQLSARHPPEKYVKLLELVQHVNVASPAQVVGVRRHSQQLPRISHHVLCCVKFFKSLAFGEENGKTSKMHRVLLCTSFNCSSLAKKFYNFNTF